MLKHKNKTFLPDGTVFLVKEPDQCWVVLQGRYFQEPYFQIGAAALFLGDLISRRRCCLLGNISFLQLSKWLNITDFEKKNAKQKFLQTLLLTH